MDANSKGLKARQIIVAIAGGGDVDDSMLPTLEKTRSSFDQMNSIRTAGSFK